MASPRMPRGYSCKCHRKRALQDFCHLSAIEGWFWRPTSASVKVHLTPSLPPSLISCSLQLIYIIICTTQASQPAGASAADALMQAWPARMDAGALGFSNTVQSKNTDIRPRKVKTLKMMLRDILRRCLSGTVLQPSLKLICKLQDLRVLVAFYKARINGELQIA